MSPAGRKSALSPAKGPWLDDLVVDADGHEFFTDSYDAFINKSEWQHTSRGWKLELPGE